MSLLQPGTRVRVANSERFATVIEHGGTPRYATIEYEDGRRSTCPVSKLAVVREPLPLYGEPGFSEGAELKAKLAELEQWRAAFGGTYQEVSERFLKGVEDDSQ